MGRIFRNLFGIYALIVFTLSVLVVLPGYFLVFLLASKERAPRLAHRLISRSWASVLFLLFGIRVKVRNSQVLDPEKTYVFAANHRSCWIYLRMQSPARTHSAFYRRKN
ncbi:MAG TPA: hypothetical protein PLI08_06500 [Bacteroidia bacterium]|nr:hypothetical protein [Bacteroidia bacterium]